MDKKQSITHKWKIKYHYISFLFVFLSPWWLPGIGCLLTSELWVTCASAGGPQASVFSLCDPPKPLWGCRPPLPLSPWSLFVLVQGVPVILWWQSVMPCFSIPCHHLCISSALSSSWTLVTDSLPTAHSVPLSSLAYHTCCCHLFQYLANISPTAFSAGHAPSGEKGFFFSNQYCWTVTQLNSDIWEISCHLSLRWFTTLIAAKISNHPVVRCVVFTALRTLPFSGFLRTASSTETESVHSNDSIKLVFKDFNFHIKF